MKTQKSLLDYTHYPVMLSEIIQILSPSAGGIFVDCTFGGGGYSKALLNFPNTKVISFDRDMDAIPKAKELEKKISKQISILSITFQSNR